MAKKNGPANNVKTGYYGYSSETRAVKNSSKKKNTSDKLRKSAIIGAVMALIQLAASVGFVAMIYYKKLSFVTAPVMAGVIGVLLALLAIVFAMEQRGSIGIKRFGKVISILVTVILLVLIYLISPFSQMSGKKVSNKPFVVFVSANDTFGSLSTDTNGRSDTNIMAVVNPKTHIVLMVSTPRDYYVAIDAEGVAPDSYDKLTHVGLYGNGIAYNSNTGEDVSASDWLWAQEVSWHTGNQALMNTLKTLYRLDISKDNYHYVQLNFTGFAELIDALGGITVDVDKSFSTKTYASYGDEDNGKRKTYTYTEGPMEMDGATALTFARERHSFGNGDMQRNKNQVKVLEAMSDKLLSGSTLLHYKSIVGSIEKSFTTDMDISSMVTLQTQVARSKGYDGWKIMSFSVTGEPSRQTLTWNGLAKSVVLQDEESVNKATTLMNMVLDGDDAETVSAQIETYENGQN